MARSPAVAASVMKARHEREAARQTKSPVKASKPKTEQEPAPKE